MRVAAIADIHGNASALRAVLADIQTQSPDLTVNLGDSFSGPLQAGEVADLLIDAAFPTVMGNHDRWLVQRRDPVGDWEAPALAQLTPRHLDWIAQFPMTQSVHGILLCHATPTDDLTYWLHRVTAEGHVVASRPEEIARYLEGVAERLVLCGHTHIARAARLPDGRMVVNPGSVGCPGFSDDRPVFHRVEAGTPHAAYAILDQRGDDWAVSFRQVPYDTTEVVRLARAAGQEEWAAVLATGWVL